ncbi:MAG TPA: hypothetical protein VIL51_10800 [Thermoleophilia bacterium]
MEPSRALEKAFATALECQHMIAAWERFRTVVVAGLLSPAALSSLHGDY